MLPSKVKSLHILVPAGCNGPIVSYTDMYLFLEVLCTYTVYISGTLGPTGICVIFLIKEMFEK